MKLKQHREDVKDLKLQQDAHVQAIAARYHRMILAFECGEPAVKMKHIKGVLRDEERRERKVVEDGNETRLSK